MSGVIYGDLLTSSRLTPSAGGVESGTVMIFNQTAAPTGWTKITGSGNDSALRVTTGTAGTGGSVAFETAFASQTVPTHQLSIAEMPAHTHTYTHVEAYAPTTSASSAWAGSVSDQPTGSTGGDGSHGHGSINLDVSYIDVIRATKD